MNIKPLNYLQENIEEIEDLVKEEPLFITDETGSVKFVVMSVSEYNSKIDLLKEIKSELKSFD